MVEARILLLVLIIGVPNVLMNSLSANKISNQCAVDVRINFRKTHTSMSQKKPGYIFPANTTWNRGGKTYGCVCYDTQECDDFPYCPLTLDEFENIGQNCESGFHVVEYHRSKTTNSTSKVPLIYSVDIPIKRIVMGIKMIETKLHSKKCKWMNNGTEISRKSPEKGSHHPRNSASSYNTLKNDINRMYSFDTSYCDCSEKKLLEDTTIFGYVGIFVSILFLLITFVIYTTLPEMRNIHGMTLRGYVGCLLIAYISLAVVRTKASSLSRVPCLFFAYIRHFSFLASFFWLNVMCFDIWWTFGGFRSLRGSVREPDRKKFLMYSVYAWGCSGLLIVICMIMDLVPIIPDNLVRPEFGVESLCWFKTEDAKALYFYGPMGFTVFCNLFFFISTIVKIMRQQKDTVAHLEGVDSRRNSDNKQWFNLYLKLFIIMGINWIMWIITWRFKHLKEYVWYITESGNEYQGLIIFIIFICTKKIKRLLVKRFSRRVPNGASRDSTTSARHSFTRNTCSTSIPQPQEKE